jgi:hypothetical protein
MVCYENVKNFKVVMMMMMMIAIILMKYYYHYYYYYFYIIVCKKLDSVLHVCLVVEKGLLREKKLQGLH